MGSGTNWYQIGNRTWYIPKLTGLKVTSLPCKCVFYRPECNTKKGTQGTEFLRFWNSKIKYTNK